MAHSVDRKDLYLTAEVAHGECTQNPALLVQTPLELGTHLYDGYRHYHAVGRIYEICNRTQRYRA